MSCFFAIVKQRKQATDKDETHEWEKVIQSTAPGALLASGALILRPKDGKPRFVGKLGGALLQNPRVVVRIVYEDTTRSLTPLRRHDRTLRVRAINVTCIPLEIALRDVLGGVRVTGRPVELELGDVSIPFNVV